MPQRGSDGFYRQLQDLKMIDGSDRKESSTTRTDTMTPTTYSSNSPSSRSTPIMTPPPLRLNTTFIGRERNALVRASLNRHQLSTLEEHSTYDYENESMFYPSPPQPSLTQPSLAQQISSSATDVRPSPTSSSESNRTPSPELNEIAVAQVHSPLTVAPLQPRKIDIPPPPSNRSSWVTTLSQPQTPMTAQHPPPPDTPPFPPPSLPSDPNVMSRFRSVDHWADYQNRMAERDRSMTSGEYSQAFKDRESATDSLSDDQKRDSDSTIAVFRNHPGEEVQWGKADGGGNDGTAGAGEGGTSAHPHPHTPSPLPLPSSSSSQPSQQQQSSMPTVPIRSQPTTAYYELYRPYQAYQPPKRMHSAKNARGAKYPWITTTTATAEPSSSEHPSNSNPIPGDDSSNPGGTNTSGNAQQQQHLRQDSEATVFKYHPGREVIIDRTSKIKSEDLDAWFMSSSR